MDDFTAFNAAPSGGIDDLNRATTAFPDISLDGDVPDVPINNTAAAAPGFSFDSFDDAPPPVRVTGDDELEKFEDQFPELEPTPAPTPAQAPHFAPKPQSTFNSTPMLNSAVEEEEPEVIKQWREKQSEEIRARDEASKQKREEVVAKAQQAIDTFYEDYNKVRSRTIRENKDQEEEFIQQRTSALTNGTTWDRICEALELQNSQSKTVARAGPGTSDLTRYKEVLLRLKREGEAAPGAAGY